jgi:pilus assembly protein CpaF
MFGNRPGQMTPPPPPKAPPKAPAKGGAAGSSKPPSPPPSAGSPKKGSESSGGRSTKPSRAKQDAFNELKTRIHRKLVEQLDLTALEGDDAQLRATVGEAVSQLAEQENSLLSFNERKRLVNEVLDETFGLGPLEVLLADPLITDILVNGPQQIYIERGGNLELTEVQFRDNAHLMHAIDKIVSSVGRRCDEVSPMVDARLKDGSRVNAIIPPLAIDGASMSIRRFGTDPITFEDYIRFNSCTEEMATFLEACVKGALNILIVGGTGSGKTTLLNNLSSFIPSTDRIVTIEDAAELQLRQPHVVRLETRPPNIEGKGAITIRDLLINTLRMRPDRIVVGECRGPETLDMLQAMNTGHDGSLTTVHANSTRDAVQRVETMVMMAGYELPTRAIRQQFASAIHLIVQAQRLSGGARKLTTVTEVQGMEGDVITMQDIFKFEPLGTTGEGKSYGQFTATGLRPGFLDHLKAHGAHVDLSMFERRVLATDQTS